MIECIWRQRIKIGDVSHRKKNCGVKSVQLNDDEFCQLPLSQRITYRDLAAGLKISTTSLVKLKKKWVTRRHSNAMKPMLKEEKKIARLMFCLSMLDSDTIPHDPTFRSMHNIIYIDKKWFNLTKKSSNYHMLQGEVEPLCCCKSKTFISKAMFLVALAHPRFDAKG